MNVVVGKPLVHPQELFALNKQDWEENEKSQTLFTNERWLPKIMVDCGIVQSVSEVKRNQPKLCINLNGVDFIKIKWGKRFLHIVVGN